MLFFSNLLHRKRDTNFVYYCCIWPQVATATWGFFFYEIFTACMLYNID